MSPVLVVVAHVIGHKPLEMRFIQNDHMVQQVSAATSHPALSDAILPWASKRGTHRLSSCFPRRCYHIAGKLQIVIEPQELGSAGVWPCFPHLLNDPKGTGIPCRVEVQNLAPVVADDEEA